MLAWEEAGLPLDLDTNAKMYGECACVMKSPKSIAPLVLSILFLCVTNSARSQMAERLARMLFPGLRILSAGSRPGMVHPYAIEVLGEVGIDARFYFSKHVQDIGPHAVGVVVNLCRRYVPSSLGPWNASTGPWRILPATIRSWGASRCSNGFETLATNCSDDWRSSSGRGEPLPAKACSCGNGGHRFAQKPASGLSP
jgi:hypothetical protein